VAQFHFEQDMAALAVRPPAHEPRAHRFVAQVIALAAALVDADAAYARGGEVFFRGAGVAVGWSSLRRILASTTSAATREKPTGYAAFLGIPFP
jgi:cysteinyl-tRNA synthetase